MCKFNFQSLSQEQEIDQNKHAIVEGVWPIKVTAPGL